MSSWSSSSASTRSGGSRAIIHDESDTSKQWGKLFIILEDIPRTIFKHWVLVVQLRDGQWIRLEGVRKGNQLKSCYFRSENAPDGELVSVNGHAMLAKNPGSMIPQQLFKCLLIDPIDEIYASPKQWQQIAVDIKSSLYTPGHNDCQTWLIEALQAAYLYSKPNVIIDVIRTPTQIVTSTVFSGVTRTYEVIDDSANMVEDIAERSNFAVAVAAAPFVVTGRLAIGGAQVVGDVSKSFYRCSGLKRLRHWITD